MDQKVEKKLFGKTKQGQEVWLFRIYNLTNDYVELLTYGCSIRSLCVHEPQGGMKDIVLGMETLEEYEQSEQNPGALLGGASFMTDGLSRRVWDVAEARDNFVFLTCGYTPEEDKDAGGVMLGVRVMWVNMNRLVIDLFMTPEKGRSIQLTSGLLLRAEDSAAYTVRSFCPQFQAGEEVRGVEETPYADQRFQPVGQVRGSFLSNSEEIKPMAELVDGANGMTVSVYSTFPALEAGINEAPKGARLTHESSGGIKLREGESFAGRVIYGIDFPHSQETAGHPELNPLAAMLKLD